VRVFPRCAAHCGQRETVAVQITKDEWGRTNECVCEKDMATRWWSECISWGSFLRWGWIANSVLWRLDRPLLRADRPYLRTTQTKTRCISQSRFFLVVRARRRTAACTYPCLRRPRDHEPRRLAAAAPQPLGLPQACNANRQHHINTTAMLDNQKSYKSNIWTWKKIMQFLMLEVVCEISVDYLSYFKIYFYFSLTNLPKPHIFWLMIIFRLI
jgi:hypothetical protein